MLRIRDDHKLLSHYSRLIERDVTEVQVYPNEGYVLVFWKHFLWFKKRVRLNISTYYTFTWRK